MIKAFVTVRAKTCLVRACQYFEKDYLKIQSKKISLALVLVSFTEHNNP